MRSLNKGKRNLKLWSKSRYLIAFFNINKNHSVNIGWVSLVTSELIYWNTTHHDFKNTFRRLLGSNGKRKLKRSALAPKLYVLIYKKKAYNRKVQRKNKSQQRHLKYLTAFRGEGAQWCNSKFFVVCLIVCFTTPRNCDTNAHAICPVGNDWMITILISLHFLFLLNLTWSWQNYIREHIRLKGVAVDKRSFFCHQTKIRRSLSSLIFLIELENAFKMKEKEQNIRVWKILSFSTPRRDTLFL